MKGGILIYRLFFISFSSFFGVQFFDDIYVKLRRLLYRLQIQKVSRYNKIFLTLVMSMGHLQSLLCDKHCRFIFFYSRLEEINSFSFLFCLKKMGKCR